MIKQKRLIIVSNVDYKTKFTIHVGIGKRYYHLIEEITQWCQDQFGSVGESWAYTGMFGNTFFEFQWEEQYTWFMIRWGAVTGYQQNE